MGISVVRIIRVQASLNSAFRKGLNEWQQCETEDRQMDIKFWFLKMK